MNHTNKKWVILLPIQLFLGKETNYENVVILDMIKEPRVIGGKSQ
jgi:hypothetical protein